jgi:hypothetical protein
MKQREYIDKEHSLVSVIVPTHNSARTLSRCLESVARQSYKHVELVVVDRYSNDRTREIAATHGAIVLLAGPERSSQKNWGATHAKGALLYFVDSDFVLEPDVVATCTGLCKDFDGVTTVNYSVGKGLWGKSIALKEHFLAHDPTIQTVRFIKKDVFLGTGGFDESLVVGEDLDLHGRLLDSYARIGSANAIEWHIGEPETLMDVVKRSVYYGKTVGRYFRKRKGVARRQLSPFKPGLSLMLIRTGSPYLVSLFVVDVTRWLSSIVGLLSSN